MKLNIGPVDVNDPDAMATDFSAARELLGVAPTTVKRGDKKGHPFRGNRYTKVPATKQQPM